ncbi:copper chaperone PCu(A)C [Yoonia litorea]|uniref:Copper(I)-binding protein n=1 Tax=Yoonia litorea TaxID=1123755 RepID=A0A1I6LL00_9RHOB|nr:copper chaperone PCu(A)C [Yoonia litorea]SFS03942.1 hypothetical protein SAMN05444714_0619 [Yoonia litorea]
MQLKTFLASLSLVFAASTSAAHDYVIGDLTIAHPYVFETTATARAGGGYLAITNTGESEDRLVAVEADFPRVMLHTTETDDGVARMVHLEDGITIGAGETVTLMPGEMHVMFMGLSAPFVLDSEVPAVLVFENAGRVDVTFKVEARDGGQMHDHHHADD